VRGQLHLQRPQKPGERAIRRGATRFKYGYLLCSRHRSKPRTAPSPTVPSMNGRATGMAIHARTTIPTETIAPARVPGTEMLPKAPRDAGFCLGVIRDGNPHLPATSLNASATEEHVSGTKDETLQASSALLLDSTSSELTAETGRFPHLATLESLPTRWQRGAPSDPCHCI
jgi:hypothetical protein